MKFTKVKIYSIIFVLIISLITISLVKASIHLPPKMLKSPDDIVYELGTSGHNLVWQFEAHESMDVPSTYDVAVNGNTSVNNQVWEDEVDIIFNVDGFAIGTYIIKITVRDNGVDDGLASPAEDEASVIVVETSTSSDSSTENSIPSSLTTTTNDTQSTDPNSTDFPSILILLSIFSVIAIFRRIKRK